MFEVIADAIMTLSNTKSVTKEDTKMTNEKMNFMELGMDDLEIVSGGTVRDMFPVQTTLQHMQLN